VKVVLVGLGDVAAAREFCTITKWSQQDVYASPTAAPYDALGFQPGFARPAPAALQSPK
jgi:hypothetical protein